MIWSRELDSYGKARMLQGEEGFCNATYQGQVYDKDINLTYNFHRWYNQEEGLYCSKDPIGLAGGNPTLYGYVKDMNSWIDPFGLDCQENKRIAKELSEPEVRRILNEKYPKEQFEILTEPRIYINNGSKDYAKPDFMVIDKRTSKVVDLVDAKNGNAGFTDFQNDLNKHGGTFNGSSRSTRLGKGTITTIQPNSLRTERTNYSISDLK